MWSSPVEESEPPQPPAGAAFFFRSTDTHMAQARAKQISFLRERQYGAAFLGAITLLFIVVALLHATGS